MWEQEVQHHRQEGVGTGMCEQFRARQMQVEFQTTSPELRGSHTQQHGRCRDNQNQQQNVFLSTPFCANLTLLCSSSNLYDSSCFTNSMLTGERGFLELLRDTTKNIQTFNGTNLTRKELATWLTKWDSLFKVADSEDQLDRVFKALMLKVEGVLWEVVNKCRMAQDSWEKVGQTIDEDFNTLGGE